MLGEMLIHSLELPKLWLRTRLSSISENLEPYWLHLWIQVIKGPFWRGGFGWFTYTQLTAQTILSESVLNLTCGLPWWSSSEVSACQCSGHGLTSWSGKIPHATGQLSLYHKTWACVPRVCAPHREATAMRSPCTTTRGKPLHAITRESPRTAMKTQHSHK